MALSDYAALLCWVGAALGVYSGSRVAVRWGWIRRDGRSRTALVILAGMLAHRAGLEMALRRRGGDNGGEGADAGSFYEAYLWLPFFAVCIAGLALDSCKEAMKKRRRKRRTPLPPRVPGGWGYFGRRA